MRTGKKGLAILLSAAMALSLCAVGASADEPNWYDDLGSSDSYAEDTHTFTLTQDSTLSDADAFAVPAGETLTIADGVTLTTSDAQGISNAGTVDINEGGELDITSSYTGEGTLVNEGVIGVCDTDSAESAILAGGTVKLLSGIELTKRLTIENGQTVTLDLNGFTISWASMPIKLTHGILNLTGTGTIEETANNQYAPVLIKGSVNEEDQNYSVLNVGENVTLKGWSGVFVDQFNSSTSQPYAYGVNVTIDGKLVSPAADEHTTNGCAVYINGCIQHVENCPQITINPTAELYANKGGQICYAAGYADWTINGGTFVGNSGIELKAGTIHINGGSFTSTAAETSHLAYDDGSSTSGYLLAAVDNVAYATPRKICISGGTFDGPIAVLDDDDDTTNNLAEIEISHGYFTGDPTDYIASGARCTSGTYSIDEKDYAYRVYVPSSGSSSGASSSRATDPVTAAPETSGTSTTVTTTVKPTVSGSTAAVTVSTDSMTSAVTSAVAAAKTSGTTPVVEVKVDSAATAASVETKLPAKALESVADSQAKLTIASPIASVTLPSEVVGSIAEKAGTADITLSIETVKPEALTAAQQAAIGGTDTAVILDLNLTAGSAKISELGGTVAVSVPYTPAANENMAHKVVWFIADHGSIIPCEGTYDAEAKTFTFQTPHFSTYVLADFPFEDVPDSYWAYSQIAWANNNGYMNGETDTSFVPTGTVTRQQLWMVLARMAGTEPADMEAAKAWASENGISDGSNPTGAVTRQQMVTILYRYAQKFCGLAPVDAGAMGLAGFEDAGAIGDYAHTAVFWACQSGILQGNSGKLYPCDGTTRAQFAVILNRFVKNTAQ